jgi:hypothetical protein
MVNPICNLIHSVAECIVVIVLMEVSAISRSFALYFSPPKSHFLVHIIRGGKRQIYNKSDFTLHVSIRIKKILYLYIHIKVGKREG